MAPHSLFETELLGFALRQALDHLNKSSRLDPIEQGLDTSIAEGLNTQVLELLRQSDGGNVAITQADAPSGSPDRLASRIVNKRRADGKPSRMDFIKIKDASLTVGISLATLAIAIAMRSPAAVGPALTGLKGIYDNWVTLKDSKDEDAMAAYDALLRHAAEMMADAIPRRTSDETGVEAEALTEFGGPPGDRCLKALKRLKELGLAEVVVWQSAAGDHDAPANRWAHRA